MRIIKLKLSEYCKTLIKEEGIKNPLDNNLDSLDLIYVPDDCRPIFVNSKHYTDMNELMEYLYLHRMNLVLFDNQTNKNILRDNFFKLLIDLTTNAKYNFEDIKQITNNKFINTIKNKLYQDNILTIWYDRINKFK